MARLREDRGLFRVRDEDKEEFDREEVDQPRTLTGKRDTNRVRVKGRILKPVTDKTTGLRDDLLSTEQRRKKLGREKEVAAGKPIATSGSDEFIDKAAEEALSGPQRGLRKGAPFGGGVGAKQFGAGGVPDTGKPGGSFNVISSEAFTNPAFTGLGSGRNIARAVRKDFAEDQRQEAIEKDLQFRRNLRERKLLDDANLNLSGDLSLGELADRAARRNSARKTLRDRDASSAEIAQASAELDQERAIAQFEEFGRNQREQIKAQQDITEQQRERIDKQFERNQELLVNQLTDEESGLDNQALAAAQRFVSASGETLGNISAADAGKLSDFGALAANLSRATDGRFQPESLSELVASIGRIDEELLPEIFDSTDLELTDEKGAVLEQVNLDDVVTDARSRRALDEIQNARVERGELTNVRKSPTPFNIFFQRPDPRFTEARSLRQRNNG